MRPLERNNQGSKRILVMDDDEDTRAILEAGLTQNGYTVINTSCADEAFNACLNRKPDLAILDIFLPGESGIDVAIRIRNETGVPFLFLSASDERNIVQQAVSAGALGYLVKPIDIFQLVPAVEAALVRASDIQALRNAQDNLSLAIADGRSTSIAVGLIMERFRMSEDEAFNVLRTQARSQQRKIADLAEEIVEAARRLNILAHEKVT